MARLVSCALLAGFLLLGDKTSADAREWTDEKDENRITAEFVDLDGDKLSLKLSNGEVTQLSLKRLSYEDQQFAYAEHVRLLSQPVKLSAAQEKSLAEIITQVQTAAKKFGELSKKEFMKAASGPLTEIIISRSEKLVEEFGSPRVRSTLVISLLEDPEPLVRAAGLASCLELGENALAAAPQIMAFVEDENEYAASFAEFVLHMLTEHGEVLLPICLNAMESNSFQRAERGRGLLSYLEGVRQSQWDEAAFRMSQVVLDEQRPDNIRIVVAHGAVEVFGFATNLNSKQGGLDNPYLYEFSNALQSTAQREALLRRFLLLLKDEDVRICSSILDILREQQPALLKEIPPETAIRLIHDSTKGLEELDVRLILRGVPTALAWATKHPEAPLMVPADEVIKLLQSENPELRQYAINKAPFMADELITRPEFLRLLKDESEHLRTMAVQILSTPSRYDFSKLPQFKVVAEADAQGKLTTLTVGKESLPTTKGLEAAIGRQFPPDQRSAQSDPDLLLEQAANDSSPDLRLLAILGLGQRQSEKALAILRKLSKDSLHEDVRESAQNALRSLHFDIDQDGMESNVKQENVTPPFVVELTVDPNMRMTEVMALFGAMQNSALYGIRWRIDDPGPKRVSVMEMMSNHNPAWKTQAPWMQLIIGTEEQGHKLRRPERPLLRLPDLAAARFLLISSLAPQPTGDSDEFFGSKVLSPYRRNSQPFALISVTPEVRCAQGRLGLEAIIFDPDQQRGSSRLLQSITWFEEGKPLSSWYVRAVK